MKRMEMEREVAIRDNTASGDDMQQCIQNCLHCYQSCLETVTYALRKGDKYARLDHIQLLQDCAEICHTSANFMIRDSNLHAMTCGLCADIYQRCADMCERIGGETEDSQFQVRGDLPSVRGKLPRDGDGRDDS